MTEYKGFSIDLIPDNEAVYFHMLMGIIESVEDAYYLSITRTPGSYKIRISLSDPELTNVLVQQLNNLNNAMHLKVDFGKSMKKSNIFFAIPTG